MQAICRRQSLFGQSFHCGLGVKYTEFVWFCRDSERRYASVAICMNKIYMGWIVYRGSAIKYVDSSACLHQY